MLDLLLLLLSDWAAFESVDRDDLEVVEELLIVDGLAAPAQELAAVGVVVPDHWAVVLDLAKEGASVRDDLSSDSVLEDAEDQELGEVVSLYEVLLDESLELEVLTIAGEAPLLLDGVSMMVLDEEVSERLHRHTEVDLLVVHIVGALMASIPPESLHLLSNDEEHIAQQLVDTKGEAVIQHRLLEGRIVWWDESIAQQELLGFVLEHPVVCVEVAGGECGGFRLLTRRSRVNLPTGEPLRAVASALSIPGQILVGGRVQQLDVHHVHLHEGQKTDHLIRIAVFIGLQQVDFHDFLEAWEPAAHIEGCAVCIERGGHQQHLPLAVHAVGLVAEVIVEGVYVLDLGPLVGVGVIWLLNTEFLGHSVDLKFLKVRCSQVEVLLRLGICLYEPLLAQLVDLPARPLSGRQNPFFNARNRVPTLLVFLGHELLGCYFIGIALCLLHLLLATLLIRLMVSLPISCLLLLLGGLHVPLLINGLLILGGPLRVLLGVLLGVPLEILDVF